MTTSQSSCHSKDSLKFGAAVHCSIAAAIGVALVLATTPVQARDTDADEFNTLAAQILNPPGAAWLQPELMGQVLGRLTGQPSQPGLPLDAHQARIARSPTE